MSAAIDFNAILSHRKAELEARLHQIEDDLEDPLSADFSEQAGEIEDAEVLEGLGQVGLAELRAVNAALDRVAAGTFGTCVRCGGPISEARLKAVPHAAVCEKCIRAG
jgi:RNA polymerase-binding transcription factor DksA